MKPSKYSVLRAVLALLAWVSFSAALGASTWKAFHGQTPAQYQASFTDLSNQGFRLKSLSGYVSGGSERYAGLWIKAAGPGWAARHGLSAADYQKAFDDFGKQGFRLVWVSAHEVGGVPRFEGIWEKRSGPAYEARHNLTQEAYQQAFNSLTGQGFRLLHVSGYSSGGAARYAAIFEKSPGPAWAARHAMTAAAYQTAFNDFGKQGYRLKLVSGFHAGGVDQYAAIWEKLGGLPFYARHAIPEAWYQNVFDNFYYQGYTPLYINAFTSAGGAKMNAIWENQVFSAADLATIHATMNAYLTSQQVPGAAIAITKDGRLVYAAGFGYANRESGEEAGPTNLFRIASVSKPVTSTAVLKLIEARKLSLTDKVFGPGSLLGAQFPTPAGNTRINQITVKHLLEHVSGLSNSGGDPMFMNLGMNHTQLISWMLNDPAHRMTRDANTQYEYLNFGFCLLARIIEKVSGKAYDTFVKQEVLGPSGITDMAIGGNSEGARKPREVKYYPSDAYSLNVTRFDGHGGWIASPIDLVRLMVRVDGSPGKPDIISAQSRAAALTPSKIPDSNGNPSNYGLGWAVGNGGTFSHNGAMSGTLAVLSTGPKAGFTFAVVVNTRAANDGFAGKLSQALSDVVNKVNAWPNHDLF
jgi:CubicO group peptidase (beta-lactamase class C family)